MSNGTHPQGMVFGYSRVSTADQDQALQENALTKAGVDRVVGSLVVERQKSFAHTGILRVIALQENLRRRDGSSWRKKMT